MHITNEVGIIDENEKTNSAEEGLAHEGLGRIFNDTMLHLGSNNNNNSSNKEVRG